LEGKCVMKRRQFLQATTATLIGASGTSFAATKRKRPNLLYVFDDQHRAASLPGEPYSAVIAPALEAFRRANFSMDQCVSNYPLCTPYRGMFMTGRWPHQTGLWRNNVNIGADELSLGRVFKGQGYHTAYVGKWHLGHGNKFIPAGPDRMGFDDWHVWEKTTAHFGSFTYDPDTGARQQSEGWSPIAMTDQAVGIINGRKQAPDEPWMMVVSYNPPHPPYQAIAEHERPYHSDDFKLRPNVRYSMQDMENPVAALHDEAGLRKVMLDYYGAITGIDEQFARLLKALDESGQADNTIVVFTSDHGEMLGSHGRMQKQCPFEEAVRVPFMVRYPGVTRSKAKSDTLFAAIDIYPTLCGLAGIAVPRHCEGRDLSAVMRGEPLAPPPEYTFLMNADDGGKEDDGDGPGAGAPSRKSPPNTARYPPLVNLPVFRGIRTTTHTYAVADSGRWLLYDNVADPYQLKNLIEDPAQRPLMEHLDALIAAWLHEAGDPFPYAETIQQLSRYPT
jgi:arylsulfatase A-like enzyme